MLKWFRKKGKDKVIDLVKLQKRGLLEKMPISENQAMAITESADSVRDSTTPTENPLGFLGSLAGAGNDSKTDSVSVDSIGGGGAGLVSNNSTSSSAFDDIKDRVESVSDRLYRILQRLEVLEKKIERMERRSGIG